MIAFSSMPGAVADEHAAPAHYGQPLAEQRKFRAGALVALPREVLRLTGPDRLSWLDSITSQSLQLAAGESTETLVLSPNGRIEHALRLVDDGESLWVIVDAAHAASLTEWLLRMRFMRQVEIADVTDDYAVIGTTGEAPSSAAVVWRDAWPGPVGGGVRYSERATEWAWSEAIVAASDAEALQSRPLAGTSAYEAARIVAGRPSIRDVDERTIPHELDWLATAVHMNKGCYRGQETVAKVHNLGAPPRRLVLLHLDGSDSVMPAEGDVVKHEATEIGQVRASAYHDEFGPVALALVKRSVDPATTLTVIAGSADVPTSIAAAQELLVPLGAGRANTPPRLPRLGAVRRPSA